MTSCLLPDETRNLHVITLDAVTTLDSGLGKLRIELTMQQQSILTMGGDEGMKYSDQISTGPLFGTALYMRPVSQSLFRALMVLSGIFLFGIAHADENLPICIEIRKLLDQPVVAGIRTRVLERSSIKGGDDQYYNLDIDEDDINDVVSGSCSSSLMPADPCFLLVSMSSGKKVEFTFENGMTFFLARYHGEFIAISSPLSVVADEKTGLAKAVPIGEVRGHRIVYLLNRDGIKPICKKL